MTTVAEYLEQTGQTAEELAARLDVKPHAVKSRGQAGKMPRTWAKTLGLELDDDEPTGREHEQTPKPPPGARVVEPPPADLGVDFSGLAGYIESTYRLAAEYAVSDPLLADAINRHAADAGRAWAKWAESEPRVAAMLQRMMVGTPMGEVIAVHVGIGAGYFLARASANRLEAEQRAAEAPEDELADDGRVVEPRPAFAGA